MEKVERQIDCNAKKRGKKRMIFFLGGVIGGIGGFVLVGCQPYLGKESVGGRESKPAKSSKEISVPEISQDLAEKKSLDIMNKLLDRYAEITDRKNFHFWMISSDLSEGERQTEQAFRELRKNIEMLVSLNNPYLLRCQNIQEKENTGTTIFAMEDFQYKQNQELMRVMDEAYGAIQTLYTKGMISCEAWNAVVHFVLDWKQRQKQSIQKLKEAKLGSIARLVVGSYLGETIYDVTCLLLFFWETLAKRGESGKRDER